LAIVLAAAALVTACAAVGPDFRSPAGGAPSTYADPRDGETTLATLTPALRASGPWWRAFGSTQLDAVMDRALAHNQTLAEARATLEAASAQAAREKAAFAPQASLAGGFQQERINIEALGFSGFPSPTIGLFSVGPTVSYDFDLFGGARRRLEAARAGQRAEAFRADAAYLSLTGNVALAAAAIASLRAQITGVEAVLADDRRSIDILRRAEAAGGDAPSVKLGGELRLERDAARLPPLNQRLAAARHALALLAGEAPSQWSPPDFAFEDFTPPATIPVEVPSELVKRRPDIQAVEADLHADTALVGARTARLYPSLRLTAGFTQEALSPGPLFGLASSAYAVGPQISVPVFDGGAIRADRRVARARAEADLARYRGAVITAFSQVSDVLSALAQDEARLAALDRAEALAKVSLDDARAAERLGGGPLSRVVVADREWREASLARIEAIGQRLGDIIALYGATAADWRAPPMPDKRSLR
jgi:NodT family efflux transporter outer membrane factor (OMF) lipoprotein